MGPTLRTWLLESAELLAWCHRRLRRCRLKEAFGAVRLRLGSLETHLIQILLVGWRSHHWHLHLLRHVLLHWLLGHEVLLRGWMVHLVSGWHHLLHRLRARFRARPDLNLSELVRVVVLRIRRRRLHHVLSHWYVLLWCLQLLLLILLNLGWQALAGWAALVWLRVPGVVSDPLQFLILAAEGIGLHLLLKLLSLSSDSVFSFPTSGVLLLLDLALPGVEVFVLIMLLVCEETSLCVVLRR